MTALSNLGYYLCGVMLLLVCAVKVPALVRRRHDARLRAACLLLLSGGCLVILAAPESIVRLNRLTGVPNIAAPVVYGVTIVFSGASLLLIVSWRLASEEWARRVSRLCVGVCGLAAVAVVALFLAGRTPVEQVSLFDTYYANTPFIREMIVTYLVVQGVATLITSVLCWRWSSKVSGSLRAGLLTLAPAYLIIACYDGLRMVAVVARWAGKDLDFLVDEVSLLLTAPSAVLGAVGFTLPLAGPRVAETGRAVRELRRLSPLWRALREVPTPGAIRARPSRWRTSPSALLTARRTALYDVVLALAPFCDPAVREVARRAAERAGGGPEAAATAGDAVMLLVARDRQRAAAGEPEEGACASVGRAWDLVPLSLALSSPVVREVHGRFPALPPVVPSP